MSINVTAKSRVAELCESAFSGISGNRVEWPKLQCVAVSIKFRYMEFHWLTPHFGWLNNFTDMVPAVPYGIRGIYGGQLSMSRVPNSRYGEACSSRTVST